MKGVENLCMSLCCPLHDRLDPCLVKLIGSKKFDGIIYKIVATVQYFDVLFCKLDVFYKTHLKRKQGLENFLNFHNRKVSNDIFWPDQFVIYYIYHILEWLSNSRNRIDLFQFQLKSMQNVCEFEAFSGQKITENKCHKDSP